MDTPSPTMPGQPYAADPTQWLRKHMGEIAAAAQRCPTLYPLTPAQRETALLTYGLAQALATGRRPCSRDNIGMILVLLCRLCSAGLPGDPACGCPQRREWQSPCALLARMGA